MENQKEFKIEIELLTKMTIEQKNQILKQGKFTLLFNKLQLQPVA